MKPFIKALDAIRVKLIVILIGKRAVIANVAICEHSEATNEDALFIGVLVSNAVDSFALENRINE